MENNNVNQQSTQQQSTPPAGSALNTKFCKFCGATIPFDAVICTACGRQVEKMDSTQPQAQPTIIVNNTNTANANASVNVQGGGKQKNKWVALVLCIFLGYLGAHKFYEGKIGMGILYLITCGLFGIGWIVDIFIIAFKPNPYYV